MPRIALLQTTTGIDPAANAAALTVAVAEAAAGGAAMLFTPEMSGMLDCDRSRAAAKISSEADDRVLAQVRGAARNHRLWVALGSLATARDDGRWANRSFLIDPEGAIAARYDKIHMFDVDLSDGAGGGESWRESNAYVPGENVVAADTPIGLLGLAICYDLRFPDLFSAFGERRCDAIALPAAFTVPTGRDHWHVMLRARAIEASAWVVAAAQVGRHEDGRTTYGHSLVIDPWGRVMLDLGEQPGVGFAEIDRDRVTEVRRQLPSLANRRPIPRSHSS